MRSAQRALGRTRSSSRPLSLLAVAAAVVACASCGGAAADARAQGPALWPYGGEAAQIFDDAIEPSSVGYGVVPDAQPAQDLRERAQIADAVLRVRVTGVNARTDGTNGWIVSCHTLETLAGKRPPPPDFDLQVDASAPAAAVLRQLAQRIASGTFVVFVEEFARADGKPGAQLHFHMAKDGPDEVRAIREAAALGGAQ